MQLLEALHLRFAKVIDKKFRPTTTFSWIVVYIEDHFGFCSPVTNIHVLSFTHNHIIVFDDLGLYLWPSGLKNTPPAISGPKRS